jgi:hypothetical protein
MGSARDGGDATTPDEPRALPTAHTGPDAGGVQIPGLAAVEEIRRRRRNCVFLLDSGALLKRHVLLLRAKRYAAVTAMPDAAASRRSICAQVARVYGALRDRRASSSAGMTSVASSRIERNTCA